MLLWKDTQLIKVEDRQNYRILAKGSSVQVP
jgi:hypothetical protein